MLNDSRFSLENIERATLSLNDPNSQQTEALNLINEWSLQCTSILTALQLIRSSKYFVARFISSTIIKNKIENYWNRIENDQKIQYRNMLITMIFSLGDSEENILNNLIDALCNIAIFDWPEEFPEFSEFFNMQANENLIKISLRVLAAFFMEVDISTKITYIHRSNLRETINSKYKNNIFGIIKSYLMIPELSNYILSIFNYMLKWKYVDTNFLDFPLFQSLLFKLLPNELTCKKTLKSFCLIQEFELNYITKSGEAILIVDAITKSAFQNQAPIVSNPDVVCFLLELLRKYIHNFIMIIYSKELIESESNEYYINNNTISTIKWMVDNEIKKETLYNNLLYLFRFLLSITNDEKMIIDRSSFLELWNEIVEKVCKEVTNKYNDTPYTHFFGQILNEIKESLFNTNDFIQTVCEETVNLQTKLFKNIYLINPEEYLEFLKNQPPSINLCMVLSYLCNNVQNTKLKTIEIILFKLLDHLQINNSPEYFSHLICVLSMYSKCFDFKNNLLAKLSELIFNGLKSGNEMISKYSVTALHNIVTRNITLLKSDCGRFIEIIISQSSSYIQNLELKTAVHMFNICTKLIRYYKKNSITTIYVEDPNRQQIENSIQLMYQKLFEPIIIILNSPNQFQNEIIEKALDIISHCYNVQKSSFDLFTLFWNPLFQFASFFIQNVNISNFMIDKVLRSIAKIQLTIQYEDAFPLIESIFELMNKRGKIEDGFFTYFAHIRNTFEEFDSKYLIIHQQIVLPYLLKGDPPSSELLKMLGEFSLNVIDIGWFSMIILQALKQTASNVVLTAIEVYKKAMISFSKEHLILYLNNFSVQLISALVELIVNIVHPYLFANLVDMLGFIFFEHAPNVGISEEEEKKILIIFKNALSTSLRQFAQEPQPGFFDNFAEYIIKQNSKCYLEDNFTNLLIVLKRACLCDIDIFKIEQKNIESDDDDLESNFDSDDLEVSEQNDYLMNDDDDY